MTVIQIRILAVIVAGLFLVESANAIIYPYRASCRVVWNFLSSCSLVKTKIVQQIQNWSSNNCSEDKTSQHCLYQLISRDGNAILATHETWQTHHFDVIEIKLAEPEQQGSLKKCIGSGYSASRRWYAYRDKGTNYCNLHNIVEASLPGQFMEYTDSSVCTDYISNSNSAQSQCDSASPPDDVN